METRGGRPRTQRVSVTAVGAPLALPFPAKFLQISNEGAAPLRIYWTGEDFTADTNYIELALTTGFFEGPAEIATIWLRGAGGVSNPVIVVSYELATRTVVI